MRVCVCSSFRMIAIKTVTTAPTQRMKDTIANMMFACSVFILYAHLLLNFLNFQHSTCRFYGMIKMTCSPMNRYGLHCVCLLKTWYGSAWSHSLSSITTSWHFHVTQSHPQMKVKVYHEIGTHTHTDTKKNKNKLKQNVKEGDTYFSFLFCVLFSNHTFKCK